MFLSFNSEKFGLKTWAKLTGDPPLARLSGPEGQELVLGFRAALADGMAGHGKMGRSPATVNKHLVAVRALLRSAGPKSGATHRLSASSPTYPS